VLEESDDDDDGEGLGRLPKVMTRLFSANFDTALVSTGLTAGSLLRRQDLAISDDDGLGDDDGGVSEDKDE